MHMKFAEKLKYERELRGWSQAKMAEELATTPNRISTWERGLALPSAYFRARLCTLLETNAEELGLLQTELHADSVQVEQGNAIASLPSPIPPAPVVSGEEVLHSRKRFTPLSRRALYLYGLALVSVVIVGISISASVGWPSVAATNPYPPHQGRLTLNDPLRDQRAGVNWQEGTNDVQARCLFKNGTYTAYQPLAGYFHACVAQLSNYTNYTYEVEMTIHAGDFGGIVFRAENSIDSHFYLFRVHTDGSYWLLRFTDRTIQHATVLDQGVSQFFRKGIGQPNLLAVSAQNNQLTLFLNKNMVSSVRDAGYSYGQIGVLAGSIENSPAEASFQNVKVWTW